MRFTFSKNTMSLPPHAKKVYQWKIFSAWEWEQQMFDGSFSTFEKIRRLDSVFCIPVFANNQICLVRDEQPWRDPWVKIMWWRMDKGLSAGETIKAEISEELWADFDSLKLYKTFWHKGKVEQKQHLYIAKWCKITHNQRLDPGGEKIELLYVDFDSFIDYVCSETCNLLLFSNEILRLKLKNGIDRFKQELFS